MVMHFYPIVCHTLFSFRYEGIPNCGVTDNHANAKFWELIRILKSHTRELITDAPSLKWWLCLAVGFPCCSCNCYWLLPVCTARAVLGFCRTLTDWRPESHKVNINSGTCVYQLKFFLGMIDVAVVIQNTTSFSREISWYQFLLLFNSVVQTFFNLKDWLKCRMHQQNHLPWNKRDRHINWKFKIICCQT